MRMTTDYEGFGEVHGLREWARRLDVNKDKLRYWLVSRKSSIEEFAAKHNIEYNTLIGDERNRVQLKAQVDERAAKSIINIPEANKGLNSGKRKTQAVELIKQLFNRSDYDTEKLILAMDVQPEKRRIIIIYNNEYMGWHHIDLGGLYMTSGEAINLLEYGVPNPRIYRDPDKGWGVHPETKVRLIDKLNEHIAEVRAEEVKLKAEAEETDLDWMG